VTSTTLHMTHMWNFIKGTPKCVLPFSVYFSSSSL